MEEIIIFPKNISKCCKAEVGLQKYLLSLERFVCLKCHKTSYEYDFEMEYIGNLFDKKENPQQSN